MDPIPGAERKLRLTTPLLSGPDVKAAQQVLHTNRFRINFHPGRIDSQWGRKAADATRLAKYLLGYPMAEVNGEFGPNVYGYLVPKGTPGYKQRPSDFVGPSQARRRVFKPNAGVRERMVSWSLWGVANSAEIHYKETRPIPVGDLWGTLPFTTDCSGSTTLYARWSGAPDPNGNDFNGSGNTMEMLAHLKQITPDRAQIGDLVVYGGDPKVQHVVVIVETGSDPTVASHGNEDGPHKLPLSQVTAAHDDQPIVHLSLL